jgi:hypothetical protein
MIDWESLTGKRRRQQALLRQFRIQFGNGPIRDIGSARDGRVYSPGVIAHNNETALRRLSTQAAETAPATGVGEAQEKRQGHRADA